MTTQAGVHEQPQPQQALLGEQQITNAGNEGFPTTRTRANPCDVAVEQSALTVQSTELEQLQAREAAHQQEVVKMKQEYKVIIVVMCSVFRPAITYIHIVYNYSANNLKTLSV